MKTFICVFLLVLYFAVMSNDSYSEDSMYCNDKDILSKQYKPKYFATQELVPPQVYKERGEKALELLDSRLLITLDELREDFGPIIINNWATGGKRQWSGLRTADAPMYSKYSQHTFGRAADLLFVNHSTEYVRNTLQYSEDVYSQRYINALELDTLWLHFDVRNCNALFTFKP